MKALREMGTFPRFLTLHVLQTALAAAALYYVFTLVTGASMAVADGSVPFAELERWKWAQVMPLIGRGQALLLPWSAFLAWILGPLVPEAAPIQGER